MVLLHYTMGSMVRRPALALCAAAALGGLLYFYGLSAAGLLGPDEPRYASVAREMARSGDWVTPRLWGEAWFEKPALLYWMGAAAFRMGLGPEWAPRLPVAAMALAFLGFYWWILRREFGPRAAWYAAAILGTSVGWVGYSQAGVTDLPMSAAFAAAMLLALPWMAKGEVRWLPLVGALLGVAVLAKGLVPLVLAVPLGLRRRFPDLFHWRVIAPFLLVALPWYVLCYLRNGPRFLEILFWQQQFERFRSPALQHIQPWWFYVPVLLAGLLPWTPLAALAARRGNWRDSRRTFLVVWVLFGLLFFSVAVNKLPGYVLPLLPALCALAGIGLAESGGAIGLTLCALLLVVFPVAARILPGAVAVGLSRAPSAHPDWNWVLALVAAVVVWMLARRGRQSAAVAVIAAFAMCGLLYLKLAALPEIDRLASARNLWREIEARHDEPCVNGLNRNLRYGLNYYADKALPDCPGKR